MKSIMTRWAIEIAKRFIKSLQPFRNGSISVNELMVLNAVAEATSYDTECTVTSLARGLDIPQSTVSRIVTEFVADGTFIQEPHPTDGRKHMLRQSDLANSWCQEWAADLRQGFKEAVMKTIPFKAHEALSREREELQKDRRFI